MADLLNISINLSKLDKNRLTKDKNGNQWLNLSGWLNDDADNYGNYGFVTHLPTKEERETKERLPILGNYRKPIQERQMNQSQAIAQKITEDDSDGDLPF